MLYGQLRPIHGVHFYCVRSRVFTAWNLSGRIAQSTIKWLPFGLLVGQWPWGLGIWSMAFCRDAGLSACRYPWRLRSDITLASLALAILLRACTVGWFMRPDLPYLHLDGGALALGAGH